MKKIFAAMLCSMVMTFAFAYADQPVSADAAPHTFTQAIQFEGQCPEVAEFSALTADDGRMLAQGCCKVCRAGKALQAAGRKPFDAAARNWACR